MDKSIRPRNDKGQKHGFWEVNWSNFVGNFNTNLFYKGNFVNDKAYGYFEDYNYDGEISQKTFYIK